MIILKIIIIFSLDSWIEGIRMRLDQCHHLIELRHGWPRITVQSSVSMRTTSPCWVSTVWRYLKITLLEWRGFREAGRVKELRGSSPKYSSQGNQASLFSPNNSLQKSFNLNKDFGYLKEYKNWEALGHSAFYNFLKCRCNQSCWT